MPRALRPRSTAPVRSPRQVGTASPPRVLFVSSHSQMGGSERVLEDLLDELPSGTVSDVVALQEGPLVGRLRDRGLPVEVIATSGSGAAMARSAARLAVLLRRVRPEVVHANGVKAAVVAVAATRMSAPLRSVPVVWMKHDVSLDGPVGRALARSCAAVACVSREVASALERTARTVIVHPGVHIDAVRAVEEAEELRRRLGLAGPVVTVIGRLDPAKGHGELLEALPHVVSEVPDVSALLVGADDPHHPGVRERLSERARRLQVSHRVQMPGHQPAPAVIAASDVVCVPTVPRPDGSGREGFGLVAAEAITLGVPVAGYDVGATGEVLQGAGRLVEVGDRVALAQQIVRLVADPAARAHAIVRGQERAADLTIAHMAERLSDLYREVAR